MVEVISSLYIYSVRANQFTIFKIKSSFYYLFRITYFAPTTPAKNSWFCVCNLCYASELSLATYVTKHATRSLASSILRKKLIQFSVCSWIARDSMC